MIVLSKLSETASKITLGWTPVPGAIGYRFQSAATAPKWSHTWDATRDRVTFAKAAWYKVEALGVEDAGEYPASAPPPPPPPPPALMHLTGSHGPMPSEYDEIAGIGYGFAVTTVQPGDITGAKAKLDAAQAAGIKLAIGMYPEPYTWNGSQYVISAAGVTSLDYFEARAAGILCLFVFNEPYWVMGLSAAQLRDLRNRIKTVWPGAKVYHDIGQPSGWLPGGPYSGGSTKWADQSGICDYCGFWDYPFETDGYKKARGLAAIEREVPFIQDQMGAIPLFLGQSHGIAAFGLRYPTDADMGDWNQAIRATLPSESPISWYTWRAGFGTYDDYLVNHPSQWPLTVA